MEYRGWEGYRVIGVLQYSTKIYFCSYNEEYWRYSCIVSTSLSRLGRVLGSTLPNLEKLVLTFWKSLSDQGLIEILNRSSSNIRELDLSGSNITGVGVGVNSLPNLEILKLIQCDNLTDRGLEEILRISSFTLRVLAVSWTNITEQGFQEGVSLLMLEELNLGVCRHLTYSGLLEILSISGNRLKTGKEYGIP